MSSRQQSPESSSRRERRAASRAQRAGQPRARVRTNPSRRSPLLSPFVLVTAGAVLVAVILVAFANRGPGSAPPNAAGLVPPPSSIPTGQADGQALGRKDAPVTLEVVGDYQCPFCGRFAREYLPRLVGDFVEPGTLRVVDHPIAFLGNGTPDESLDAAVGAVCAGRQNHYWPYHDYLMWNQHGENQGAFSRETLRSIATAVGLDLAAWDKCFADPSVAQEVRAGTQQAAAQGITSTPTFLLNGKPIVGLVPYDELAAEIRTAAGAAPSGAGGGAVPSGPASSEAPSPAGSVTP